MFIFSILLVILIFFEFIISPDTGYVHVHSRLGMHVQSSSPCEKSSWIIMQGSDLSPLCLLGCAFQSIRQFWGLDFLRASGTPPWGDQSEGWSCISSSSLESLLFPSFAFNFPSPLSPIFLRLWLYFLLQSHSNSWPSLTPKCLVHMLWLFYF